MLSHPLCGYARSLWMRSNIGCELHKATATTTSSFGAPWVMGDTCPDHQLVAAASILCTSGPWNDCHFLIQPAALSFSHSSRATLFD